MCGSTYQCAANSWQTGNYLGTSNQVNSCDSTANNFHLSQVKFEVSPVATAFRGVSVPVELLKCQRYFQAWGSTTEPDYLGNGQARGGGTMYLFLEFKTNMRSDPIVSTESGTSYEGVPGGSENYTDCTYASSPASGRTPRGCMVTFSGSFTSTLPYIVRCKTNKRLWVRCEL